MEHPGLNQLVTRYPIPGNDLLEKYNWEILPGGETGRVWINAEQYFDNVPVVAWEFHIGDYQPAQKWLKDRQNSILSYDDIMHYQRIINALQLTDSIMNNMM